jgi:hypothetical protein
MYWCIGLWRVCHCPVPREEYSYIEESVTPVVTGKPLLLEGSLLLSNLECRGSTCLVIYPFLHRVDRGDFLPYTEYLFTLLSCSLGIFFFFKKNEQDQARPGQGWLAHLLVSFCGESKFASLVSFFCAAPPYPISGQQIPRSVWRLPALNGCRQYQVWLAYAHMHAPHFSFQQQHFRKNIVCLSDAAYH